ncbi:MAG: TrmB family transcriptional regulator [Candidatus Thermoplasmatota archaeon]|jgi:sugar-specific transcriptional regulator TrmB|nr:TrmB family transcriptional regulator [Candidatus Thermoplasmatota archaeon]MCL4412873.1 TrmB family transcriptional regulator [Candidatus Thermoplasmatota archaeon]MCW6158839.1 TrmB family transcriptional regulator [Thermoplasmatales archaeon]
MEDFEKELAEVSKYFESFAMTDYELRGFLALILLGASTPDTIAMTAKIPRTSTYKVLEKLEERGFITSLEGRPKVFKAKNIYEIRKNFSKNLDILFEKLTDMSELLTQQGLPQLIYTIYGRDRVLEKMKEVLNSAERFASISTPKLRELRQELGKEIESAITRNVTVSIVAPDNQRVPQGTRVFRNNSLIATDMVSDGSRALIAAPDLSACGFSDNPLLAEHINSYIEMLSSRKI